MAVNLTVFIDPTFRSVEEPAKVGDDYHYEYSSSIVRRLIAGSSPQAWTVYVKDGSGAAVNLTGATVKMRATAMKRKDDGTLHAIAKTLTVTDATNGVATLSFAAADLPSENMYLAVFEYSKDSDKRITPKKLRIEVVNE